MIDTRNNFDGTQTFNRPRRTTDTYTKSTGYPTFLTVPLTDPQDKPNDVSEVVKHEIDGIVQDYNQPKDELQVDIPEGSVLSEPIQDIIAEPRRSA